MDGDFDIAALRRRLAELMAEKQVKPTTLSLRVGKSPTLVKDLLEKTSDTKLSTIFKLAGELGVSVADLLGDGVAAPMGPPLFVKGEVAAGHWVEAFEWPVDDWRQITGRPDVSVEPQWRFFLKVSGDSMNLVYPEGSFVECVSVFGGAEPTPGRNVIVVRRRSDQLLEATVKELVADGEDLWLRPRSTNPAHQAFRLNEPQEDVEEVQIIAVVVSSVRPE